MEIGLFYQLPAWPEQRPGDRYEDTLRQIELGDVLGFSVAWLAELHFEASRGILPAPLLFAAAAAQRTQRIGLGTAVVLLPLHDPLRLAEETAMLDHLSRGRLRLGIGRGHGRGHYGGFGIDVEERTSRFDEALEVMRRAWRPEPLRFRGRHFAYDGVSVVPKPLQQPHPPLLMAANSDDSVETAIALEIPVMMATVTATPEQIEARSRRYRSALPDAPERDVALLVPIHVAETDALARRDCEASHLSYYHDLARLARADSPEGTPAGPPGGSPIAARIDRFASMTFETAAASDTAVGAPETVLRRLTDLHARYRCGHIMAWFSFGGRIPHDRVLASMRLFAEEVAPRLP